MFFLSSVIGVHWFCYVSALLTGHTKLIYNYTSVLKRFSHLGSVMRLSLYLNQLYYQEVLDKPIRSN